MIKRICLILTIMALQACGVEDNDCAREDMYIEGHEAVTMADGSVNYYPILKCP